MPIIQKTRNKIFYSLKPMIPRSLQLFLRRKLIAGNLNQVKDIWPIDPESAVPPSNWKGWPQNKKFALILTHDVESGPGQEKVAPLMKVEKELGFRSSFNFVPEKYAVRAQLREQLQKEGFEVGVHGLKHDGKLLRSKNEFEARAIRINHYLAEWKAVGFRAPAMHKNLDWFNAFDIEYDASTFDTDPFEPQSTGVGTIFPFYVQGKMGKKGFVELPYTLPQDFTPLVLMREKKPHTWIKKLDWIAEQGGMALINVHPDYINFTSGKPGSEEYSINIYSDFLKYIKKTYDGQFWHVLPREMAEFWQANYSQLADKN